MSEYASKDYVIITTNPMAVIVTAMPYRMSNIFSFSAIWLLTEDSAKG